MQINRISPNIRPVQPKRQNTNNNQNNNPQFKGGREILKAFTVDPIVSTLALEVPCDAGRSINAFKRGGMPEFRERATDDIVSALFWIKGVDMFNAVGDKIGKHFLKLPETQFDVGKDALRTPFDNLVKDQSTKMNLSEEATQKLSSKLAGFKFTKILASAALTVGFMGFLLPKVNQGITDFMYKSGKNKKKTNSTPSEQQKNTQTQNLAKANISFEEFDKKISSASKPSFKGADLTTVAHLLEDNPICKMLVSDSGMLAGRCVTARNADEGREYLFRDLASAVFYYASVPAIYKGLETASKSSSLTALDAVSVKNVHNNILNQVKEAGGKMSVSEFREKTLGTLSETAENILKEVPFKNDVVSLSELKKHLPENLVEKAVQMAKLQPEKAAEGAVLTRQQAIDVLNSGSLSAPEFLTKTYKDRFGEALTNPYKYIPMKNITSLRDNIDKYTEKVIETATKKNNGIVDEKLLNSLNKKSFGLSAAYRAIAIGISAFALGVAIPKIQYAITAKKTGSNAAPGLRQYEEKA